MSSPAIAVQPDGSILLTGISHRDINSLLVAAPNGLHETMEKAEADLAAFDKDDQHTEFDLAVTRGNLISALEWSGNLWLLANELIRQIERSPVPPSYLSEVFARKIAQYRSGMKCETREEIISRLSPSALEDLYEEARRISMQLSSKGNLHPEDHS